MGGVGPAEEAWCVETLMMSFGNCQILCFQSSMKEISLFIEEHLSFQVKSIALSEAFALLKLLHY